MLDNRYALLFVRGERPIQDEKYDIANHPRVKLTTDGGQPPYRHGVAAGMVAVAESETITKSPVNTDQNNQSYLEQPAFELLSEEELEERFQLNEKE